MTNRRSAAFADAARAVSALWAIVPRPQSRNELFEVIRARAPLVDEQWKGVLARAGIVRFGLPASVESADELSAWTACEAPHIGSYVVERVLGAGGLGTVFRCADTRLERTVALKVLHGDAENVAAVLREARALARAAGEHVVRVYDVIEHERCPVMVMEYLEGETLEQYLSREGALPAENAVDLILAICQGVASLHSAGLVHQDLSPSNILRDPSGRWRVADFGLAGPFWNVAVVGETKGYGALEQILGEVGKIGPQTDVWALGVLLYRALAAELPFPTDNDLYAARMRPLSTRGVPADLSQIIADCLHLNVGDRFESAAALGGALRDWRDARRTAPSFKALLWKSAFQPPSAVIRGALRKPGSLPTTDSLAQGCYAPRGDVYRAIHHTVSEWLGTLRGRSASERVPVFWIGGPSGAGKSVALLHLMAALHADDWSPIFWLGRSLKPLGDLLSSALIDPTGTPTIIGIDDPYRPGSGRRLWLDALNDRRVAGQSVALICCGPSEQLDAFKQDLGEHVEVGSLALQTKSEEVWELADWYRERTGQAPRLLERRNPLIVQLFFEWQINQSLDEFAARFRNRLLGADPDEQRSRRFVELFSRMLAINRLYLTYPSAAHAQLLDPAAQSLLNRLIRDEQLEEITAEAGAGGTTTGVRVAHPQLANAIYECWFPSPACDEESAGITASGLVDCLTYGATEDDRLASLTAVARALEHQHAQAAAATGEHVLPASSLQGAQSLVGRRFPLEQEHLQRIYAARLGALSANELVAWLAIQRHLPRALDPHPLETALQGISADAIRTRPEWLLECVRALLPSIGDDPRGQRVLKALLTTLSLTVDANTRGWPSLSLMAMAQEPVRAQVLALSVKWLQAPQNAAQGDWPALLGGILKNQRDLDRPLLRALREIALHWLAQFPGHPQWHQAWLAFHGGWASDDTSLPTAMNWLQRQQDHEGWPQVWRALWLIREDDGVERVDTAALAVLAERWLAATTLREEWWKVWQALRKGQPDDGHRLSVVATNWLEKASSAGRDSRFWSRLWRHLWSDLTPKSADRRRLRQLGLAWLDTVRADHDEWLEVWRNLKEDWDHRLGEVSLNWLRRARADLPRWDTVWSTVYHLEEAKDELLRRAETWLTIGHPTSSNWPDVWRDFAKARPDDALFIATHWLARTRPTKTTWSIVWLELWNNPRWNRTRRSRAAQPSAEDESFRGALVETFHLWCERGFGGEPLLRVWLAIAETVALDKRLISTGLQVLQRSTRRAAPRVATPAVQPKTFARDDRFDVARILLECKTLTAPQADDLRLAVQRLLTAASRDTWSELWLAVWRREQDPVSKLTLVAQGIQWLVDAPANSAGAHGIWAEIWDTGRCRDLLRGIWNRLSTSTHQAPADSDWARGWTVMFIDEVGRTLGAPSNTAALTALAREGYAWLSSASATVATHHSRNAAKPGEIERVWCQLWDVAEAGLIPASDVPYKRAALKVVASRKPQFGQRRALSARVVRRLFKSTGEAARDRLKLLGSRVPPPPIVAPVDLCQTAPAGARKALERLQHEFLTGGAPNDWAALWDAETRPMSQLSWRMLWDRAAAPDVSQATDAAGFTHDLRLPGEWRKRIARDDARPELLVCGLHWLMRQDSVPVDWHVVWCRLWTASPGHAPQRALEALALDLLSRSDDLAPFAAVLPLIGRPMKGIVEPWALAALKSATRTAAWWAATWCCLWDSNVAAKDVYSLGRIWIGDAAIINVPAWYDVWSRLLQSPEAASRSQLISLLNVAREWLRNVGDHPCWALVFETLWESSELDLVRADLYAEAKTWLPRRGLNNDGWGKVWRLLVEWLPGRIPAEVLEIGVQFLQKRPGAPFWVECFLLVAPESGDVLHVVALDWLRADLDHVSWPEIWRRVWDSSPHRPPYRDALMTLALQWLATPQAIRDPAFSSLWLRLASHKQQPPALTDLGMRWLEVALSNTEDWPRVFGELSVEDEVRPRLHSLADSWRALHPTLMLGL